LLLLALLVHLLQLDFLMQELVVLVLEVLAVAVLLLWEVLIFMQ
jgi:hypothetical protein